MAHKLPVEKIEKFLWILPGGAENSELQHLRQVPTTSDTVRAAGRGRPGFPHKSTFVNLMLDKKAKPNQMRVKILSYFQLENYKMYERFSSCRALLVENSVESVEIHLKNKRQRWTFARSPPSFQLVEKMRPFYGLYTRRFVENFRLWANRRITAAPVGNTTPHPGRGRGENSRQEKTAFLWQ